jgi:LmbE family N-acetylglucosaminyl deacetylase
MTVLVLLAHQDDELGVLSEIEAALARGERVVCAFLTSGAFAGVSAERRNGESRAALSALGVPLGDIRFVGAEVGIGDGRLVEHLDTALAAVGRLTREVGPVHRILLHAWEGGHQDHDAVHLVGLALAHEHGLVAATRQFPLYRSPGVDGRIAFKAPLAANGPIERHRIPVLARVRYLLALRHYPSQLRVMAQLAPRFLWDFVVDGSQKLQPVSEQRVRERPNEGTMLYEQWGLYTYARFHQAAMRFVEGRLAPVSAAPSPSGAGAAGR